MFWILNFIFSFLASMFFCVIFDAPRNYIYHVVSLVRVGGWFTPYSSTALMCTLYTLVSSAVLP